MKIKTIFAFSASMFFAAMFLLQSEVNAQNTSLGLRTGINFSNFGGADGEGDGMLGANFGAFGMYSITPNFGTALEVNYMMKGAKDPNNSDNKTSVNYMEIPLYANVFLNTTGNIRAKVFAGPTFGFLMTAKREEGDTSTDIKESFESTDIGATVGAGAHIKVSQENWLWLDVRYGLGLTDITVTENSEVKNNVLSVNIGVSFPLGNY